MASWPTKLSSVALRFVAFNECVYCTEAAYMEHILLFELGNWKAGVDYASDSKSTHPTEVQLEIGTNNNEFTKFPLPRYQSCPWTYPVPAVTPHVQPSALPLHLSLLHIRRRKGLDHTRTIHEPRSEDAVGICEHAVLQTDDDELTAAESRANESANVLGVREIESGVDLIKNVHGRW